MSFGHALYYPNIELNNKNWLKHAFLFWDKISRIVPSTVRPSDSEDIIRIRYETGFIEDYSPESWVVSDAFHSFSKFLEDFIESDRFYRHFRRNFEFENYNHEYNHKKRFREDIDYRRDILQTVAKQGGTYIHIQKMDRRMKELLLSTGLAIPGKNEWEDWVRIDNEIGFVYMSYLAKVISKEKSIPVVTDTEQSFSASSSYDCKIFKDYEAEFEYKLGNLLIATFVPKDINRIPFDKLIDFREKYAAERNAFFTSIIDLCQNIPTIDNESALKDALNHYKKNLIDKTNQLKKAFEANKIETTAKFLGISIPTTMASLSNYVPIEYKPLGIGAGIVFGLATAANTAIKERNQLREKPLSYLLSINSELSGDNLLKKINDGISGIRKW